MTDQKPTVVLVHGAFAESASWNDVTTILQEHGASVIAAANPLRSLAGDAAYIRDVIASIDGPVVLVGHSYAGMVITEAAANNTQVVALVYVNAFVPDTGQSAFDLSASSPGSTLGDALAAYPVATGGNEFVIRPDLFHHQFAGDVSEAQTDVDGGDAAAGYPGGTVGRSLDRPTGMEGHSVVARVQRSGPEHPCHCSPGRRRARLVARND